MRTAVDAVVEPGAAAFMVFFFSDRRLFLLLPGLDAPADARARGCEFFGLFVGGVTQGRASCGSFFCAVRRLRSNVL